MKFLPTLDLLKVVHTFHPQYQSKTRGRKRRDKKFEVFQTVNNTWKSTEEPGFIFDSFIYRIIKNQI